MTEESPSQNPSTVTGGEAPQPGKATRIGATVVLALIAGSLLWYFAADRLTPHTTQARVQAFVVPVAAEVAGKVLAVHVRNNDEVQAGQPLFDIDPEPVPDRTAAQPLGLRVGAQFGQCLGGNRGGGTRLAAGGAGQSSQGRQGCDAARGALRRGSRRDIGAPAGGRAGDPGRGAQPEKAAEADLRKAQEAAGESGDNNAQLRSARSAIEKAELDLARTTGGRPRRGIVSPTCAPMSAISPRRARRR
jgi:multidrug efflux pump subunit AcrA (membrane-fusion protein)